LGWIFVGLGILIVLATFWDIITDNSGRESYDSYYSWSERNYCPQIERHAPRGELELALSILLLLLGDFFWWLEFKIKIGIEKDHDKRYLLELSGRRTIFPC